MRSRIPRMARRWKNISWGMRVTIRATQIYFVWVLKTEKMPSKSNLLIFGLNKATFEPFGLLQSAATRRGATPAWANRLVGSFVGCLGFLSCRQRCVVALFSFCLGCQEEMCTKKLKKESKSDLYPLGTLGSCIQHLEGM